LRRWQRPGSGLLVDHSDLIGHIMEYGMKLIVIGVTKTKQIPQSPVGAGWIGFVGVVAIGRKVLCTR
jgi:hypothetical protein